MIRSAKIDNFKFFKELEVRDIPRILIVGGRNGSGKTSLLEALFAFFDRNNPLFLLRLLQWRGIGSVPLKVENLLAPFFGDLRVDRPIRIEIEDEFQKVETLEIAARSSTSAPNISWTGHHAASGAVPPSAPASTDMLTSTSSSTAVGVVSTSAMLAPEVGMDITSTRENARHTWQAYVGVNGPRVQTTKPLRPANPVFFVAARDHLNPTEEAVRLGELDKARKLGPLISGLQIVDHRLIGLTTVVEQDGPRIYADLGGLGSKILLNLVGDGMWRLLDILLAIGATKNGAVFIDEVEIGLHYSVMPKVWKAIHAAAEDNNCQVFATTHSYDAVRAAHQAFSPDMPSDFAYVRMNREKDVVSVTRYPTDSLSAAIEEGIEIR